MFIRPWVRIILARLKNPKGWTIGEHTIDLEDPKGRVLLALWHCHGRIGMKVWSWGHANKPKSLAFNWFEKWAVFDAVRQHRQKIFAREEVDLQSDVITKLTNLED